MEVTVRAMRVLTVGTMPSGVTPKASALRFPCLLHGLPQRVGEFREVVEFARAAQPLPAVNHDAFAIDVGGLLAHQVGGQVGELLVAAEAFHRMAIAGALLVLF